MGLLKSVHFTLRVRIFPRVGLVEPFNKDINFNGISPYVEIKFKLINFKETINYIKIINDTYKKKKLAENYIGYTMIILDLFLW